jgi:hypothetical protein
MLLFERCAECGGRSVHPVRHLRVAGQSACIDEGIADLVLACWQVGLRTSESCQDFLYPDEEHEPEMFLSMATFADHLMLGAFLIEGGPPGPVLDRLLGHSSDTPRWDLAARPSTAAWDGERPADPPRADVWHSVTFPPADLEDAITRLRNGAALYPTATERAQVVRRLLTT